MASSHEVKVAVAPIAGASARLSPRQKLCSLGIFALLLAGLATLIAVYRSVVVERPIEAAGIQLAWLVLMGLVPLALARRLPAIAGFDRTWFPRKGRDVLGFFLMLGAIFLWVVVCVNVGKRLGLSMELRDIDITWVLTPEAVLIFAALGIFLSPVAEEIFWRGYALGQFEKVAPKRLALIAQAVLFSLVHARPLGPTIDLIGFGLILGFWRQRRRSLVPLILAHMLVNGVAYAPNLAQHYRDAVFFREIGHVVGEENLSEMVHDIVSKPACRKIADLAEGRPEEAIRAIIPFLGDPDDLAKNYASVKLASLWEECGVAADPDFREALNSENAAIVSGVMLAIEFAHRNDFAPILREVVMGHKDPRVQVSGVLTLRQMRDVEGLRMIASRHTSEKVRKWAESAVAEVAEESGSTPEHQ